VCIVVDDLDSKFEEMRGRGIAFHAQPTKLVGDTKMVYVRDPDGIVVELIEPAAKLTLAVLLKRNQRLTSQ
jgi:catechol 2,3-dioxygenase-like lactoylglutathione lyase family enzyme